MKVLIYEATGIPVRIGDVVKVDTRFYFVREIIHPTFDSGCCHSKGRVRLKILEPEGQYTKEIYMPDEIGAVFVDK